LKSPVVGDISKWSNAYPAHRYGWYYKTFPSNTAWKTIKATSGEGDGETPWAFVQPTNPLKTVLDPSRIPDGSVWFVGEQGANATTFDGKWVLHGGLWSNIKPSYFWCRSQLAKDMISLQYNSGWAHHLGVNGAFGFRTAQGWLNKDQVYAIAPCISI
jgi:hypothetical protein